MGSDSEWAIVGGTGVFAMARGIIERKFYQQINGGEIQELTISGFCRGKVRRINTTRFHFSVCGRISSQKAGTPT
jgi:hypothetical protein